MKKFFKFIFGFIGALLLLVITLTIVLGIALHNKRVASPDKADESLNRSTANVINAEVEKSMSNSVSEKKVNLLLDEEALEYLFLSITSTIGKEANKALNITGIDVDVVDSKYSLMMSGQVSFYKTLITCGLSFKETDEAFSIKLEGLKAGKLNVYSFRWLASLFVNSKKIEESLEKKGLYLDLDFSTFTIIFTKDNIKKMLVGAMGDDEEELVNVLGDIFLSSKDILEFNLGKDNLLGAILHLQMLEYSEEELGALPYHYDFDSLVTKTKTLITSNIITYEKTGVVFQYLVKGYDVYKEAKNDENDEKIAKTNEQNKKNREYIDSLDLSVIGINNNSAYKGIMNKPEGDSNKVVANGIKDALSLSIEQMIINKGFSLTITDDTLTEALKTLSLVGFSSAFANDLNGEVAYVVVEQLNFICHENKVIVDLIANINGERIYIEVSLDTLSNNNGLSLTGSIDYIRIGEKNLSDENKISLLKYLKNATSEVNWINVEVTDNPSTSYLILNFHQLLNDNSSIGAFMANMAELSLSITNETKVVEGGIVITYHH